MVALLPKPRERGISSVAEQENAKRRRLARLKKRSAAMATIGARKSCFAARETVTRL